MDRKIIQTEIDSLIDLDQDHFFVARLHHILAKLADAVDYLQRREAELSEALDEHMDSGHMD